MTHKFLSSVFRAWCTLLLRLKDIIIGDTRSWAIGHDCHLQFAPWYTKKTAALCAAIFFLAWPLSSFSILQEWWKYSRLKLLRQVSWYWASFTKRSSPVTLRNRLHFLRYSAMGSMRFHAGSLFFHAGNWQSSWVFRAVVVQSCHRKCIVWERESMLLLVHFLTFEENTSVLQRAGLKLHSCFSIHPALMWSSGSSSYATQLPPSQHHIVFPPEDRKQSSYDKANQLAQLAFCHRYKVNETIALWNNVL